MADNEKHLFANDGSDWTTPPSPVDSREARAQDAALDKEVSGGEGPAASNEVRLHHTIVEGSESQNPAADEDGAEKTESDEDEDPRKSKAKK